MGQLVIVTPIPWAVHPDVHNKCEHGTQRRLENVTPYSSSDLICISLKVNVQQPGEGATEEHCTALCTVGDSQAEWDTTVLTSTASSHAL